MKSAMGLGFKRKRETPYEHRDDCQMPLLYTKRKDDRSFIKESSRVKKKRHRKCATFAVCTERVLKLVE